MNINLLYEGKNYNFDIPNDVTLDYLKELSSKIFNSEKRLLDLMYNNKKLSDDSNNVLIRDLIPEGESNVILTVQANKNLNMNATNKTKKKSKEGKKVFEYLKEREPDNNEINKEKNIIIPKEEEENQIIENNDEKIFFEDLYDNNNVQSKIRLMLSNNKMNNKEMSRRERFKNRYLQKQGELLFLMRQFSEKVKKLYLILYNKYKTSNTSLSNTSSTKSFNSLTKNNNIEYNMMDNSFYELALYEKKIITYLEMQIQHYKSLIEIMQTYDKYNISFSRLSGFYKKLFEFNLEEIFNGKMNIKVTKNPMNINRKLINNNSSIDITSFKCNNYKLPALKLKYFKPPIKKETKDGKDLKKIIYESNFNFNQTKDIKNKNRKSLATISRNPEKEYSNNNQSNFNTINKNNNNNNILDNISEKNSTENEEEYKNITPINLRKTISNKYEKNDKDDKDEINDYITPIKDLKFNQRKDSVASSMYKYKYPLDKKDFDINQNKSCKIKEINVSSMSVKDSNFKLEKKLSNKNKAKSINRYDYVM